MSGELPKAAVADGDRLRFDGKRIVWRVRASTANGRYTLTTAAMFGRVHYSVIDWERGIRGAMNVIGQGLGIFTTKGPDEHVDEAIAMLEGRYPEGIGEGYFTISHRNNVPLNITDRLLQKSRFGYSVPHRKEAR